MAALSSAASYDEAAEHDFGEGIGFVFGHAELHEVSFKPEQQAARAQQLV